MIKQAAVWTTGHWEYRTPKTVEKQKLVITKKKKNLKTSFRARRGFKPVRPHVDNQERSTRT